MVISMLITRMNIAGLTDPATERRACAFLIEERKAHALSYHKEKNRAQSIGAWLLFTYSLHRWLQASGQEKRMPEEAADELEEQTPVKTVEQEKQKLQVAAGTQDMGAVLTVTEATVEKVLEELRALSLTEREKLLWASKVRVGEHGKPYLQSSSDIFFNLSHSGDYVLCGIAKRQIGVDIQKRHDKDVSGVKEKIHNAQDKEEDFFLLFSAKEAFCKCMGEGLQRDLSHIAVDAAKNTVMDTATGETGWLFTDFTTESEIQGYVETVVVV